MNGRNRIQKERPDFLTIKDLQERLGIGKNTAYALMKSECFPSIQLGRKWIIEEDAFYEWIKDNRYSKVIIE